MATTPNFADLQDFSKKQLEAIASASSLWTKGMHHLAAELTDYSKKAFETGSATFEKLLTPQSRPGPNSVRLRQAGV